MIKRDDLLKLLADMLALQTARDLRLVTLLPEAEMEPIQRNAREAAERMLELYDKESTIKEIKQIIIDDVRHALLKRTRISRALEWGINISSVIIAVIIGAGQFVFTLEANLEAVRATYWIILGLISFNFLGFLYLRHVDPT